MKIHSTISVGAKRKIAKHVNKKHNKKHNNISTILKSIVDKMPYARYACFIWDDGQMVWVNTRVDEYNADSVGGKLYASVVASCVPSYDGVVKQVAIGASQDIVGCFGVYDIDSLGVVKGVELSVAIDICIECGEPYFVGGDNSLVKALLGIGVVDGVWGMVAGLSSVDNIPMYKPMQATVVVADCEYDESMQELCFMAKLKDTTIGEVMLCMDNQPVVRDNKKRYLKQNLEIPILNGWGCIDKDIDGIDGLVINGNKRYEFYQERICSSVQSTSMDIITLDCDYNTKIVADLSSKYIVLYSNNKIVVFGIEESGMVSTHLNVPNDRYHIVQVSNGHVALYDGASLKVYWIDKHGKYTSTSIELEYVDNLIIKYMAEDSLQLVMTVAQNTLLCKYDKASNEITTIDTMLDCYRIFNHDGKRVYIDDGIGEECYLKSLDINYSEIASLIGRALMDKELFGSWNGLYLYDNGRYYNTIHNTELRLTGFGVVGQRVFMCRSFCIVQDTDSRVGFYVYDRCNDKWNKINSTIKPSGELSVGLSGAIESNGYFILVYENGTINCYQHDLIGTLITYDNATSQDIVLLPDCQVREPNASNIEGVSVEFKLY